MLRELRDERGLGLREVARAVGVDAATISRWESRDLVASGRVERLAAALGVSVLLLELLLLAERRPALTRVPGWAGLLAAMGSEGVAW